MEVRGGCGACGRTDHFGKGFGNYNQDISVRINYSPMNESIGTGNGALKGWLKGTAEYCRSCAPFGQTSEKDACCREGVLLLKLAAKLNCKNIKNKLFY